MKRIEGIADIRDESDRQGMRVVIELKRDAMADVVLNQPRPGTAKWMACKLRSLSSRNSRR